MKDTNGHFELRTNEGGMELWNMDKGLKTAEFEMDKIQRLRMAAELIGDYAEAAIPVKDMLKTVEVEAAWKIVHADYLANEAGDEPYALWEFELMYDDDYPPFVEALKKVQGG